MLVVKEEHKKIENQKELHNLFIKFKILVEKLKVKEINHLELKELMELMLYFGQLGVKLTKVMKVWDTPNFGEKFVGQLFNELKDLYGELPPLTILKVKYIEPNELSEYVGKGYKPINEYFSKTADIYSNMPITAVLIGGRDAQPTEQNKFIHPVANYEIPEKQTEETIGIERTDMFDDNNGGIDLTEIKFDELGYLDLQGKKKS